MRAAPYRLLFVLAASLTFLISWGALAQEPTLTPLPTETPTETATLLPPPLPPTESPLPSLTPTQPATSPAWSPDGSLLAYIRTVPGATPDALQRHLAYVTSDCREGVSCVDEQLAVSLSYQFSDLDWSATGDRLMAVQANMSAGGPGVTQDVLVEYTLGRSGTSLWVGSFSTVTQAPSIASPSYNATGTKAAYETTNNGVNEIRFVQRNIVNGGLDVVEGVAVTGVMPAYISDGSGNAVPNVEITVTSNPAQPLVGEVTTLTITLRNIGSQTAVLTRAEFSWDSPQSLQVLSSTPQGTQATANHPPLVWTGSALPPTIEAGATVTLVVQVQTSQAGDINTNAQITLNGSYVSQVSFVLQVVSSLQTRLVAQDIDFRRFDEVYVAIADGQSATLPVLNTNDGSDWVNLLQSLTLDPANPDPALLLNAINRWAYRDEDGGDINNSALERCNYQIPNYDWGSDEFKSRATYRIPEYGNITNHRLWQLCITHVSLLAFIQMTSAYPDISATYEYLIQALLRKEYGFTARLMCRAGFRYQSTGGIPQCDYEWDQTVSLDVRIWLWADEGIARQLYAQCSTDGCQSQSGTSFQLYAFLSYFQPARNGQLQRGLYEMLSESQNERDTKSIIRRSALSIVDPPTLGSWSTLWTSGQLEAGRPYGFATDIAGNSEWLSGRRLRIDQRLYPEEPLSTGCNNESMVIDYEVSGYPEGRFNIFFGTYFLPEGVETCRFRQFLNDGVFSEPGPYRARVSP